MQRCHFVLQETSNQFLFNNLMLISRKCPQCKAKVICNKSSWNDAPSYHSSVITWSVSPAQTTILNYHHTLHEGNCHTQTSRRRNSSSKTPVCCNKILLIQN